MTSDRDRLIELLNKVKGTYFFAGDNNLNLLADYLLSNGVFILPEDLMGTEDFSISAFIEAMKMYKEKDQYIKTPCKVGEWLWVVRKDYVSQCFRVDGFDDKNLVMYMQDNEHNLSLVYKGIKIWRVSFDDFGKTVFITKEEAEEKLKELRK